MVNKDKEISIIIPVYNERDVISAKLKEVNDFIREQGYTYEIIVIDDAVWMRYLRY